MLKKMSAALIVASLFAVPAMAASTAAKTDQAPAAQSQTLKPSVANANAKDVKKTTKHSKKSTKKHTSALKTKKHIASAKKVHVAGLKKQKVTHKKG